MFLIPYPSFQTFYTQVRYSGTIDQCIRRCFGPSIDAIVALADALGTSAAAFFQFENEEANEKTLRKKIEVLIADTSAEELQRVSRVLRAMLEP